MIHHQSFESIIVYYLIRFIDKQELSDCEVALIAQVSRSTIAEWRKTGCGNPKVKTVDKILDALKVKVEDFILAIFNDIMSGKTGFPEGHRPRIGIKRDWLLMEFVGLISKMDYLE